MTQEQRLTSETLPAPTKKLVSDSISGDETHTAFNAGYALGKMERFEFEVEEYARALLHRDARRMSDWASRLAAVKGPAWAALITECGESDD